MDRIRRNAEIIGAALTDEMRALWLAWVADLVDYLAHLDVQTAEMRVAVRDLSERITIVIHDAVRESAAGYELRIAAIDEHLRAEIQRISQGMDALSQQSAQFAAALEAQTRHQDAQHLQILGELIKIHDRIINRSAEP